MIRRLRNFGAGRTAFSIQVSVKAMIVARTISQNGFCLRAPVVGVLNRATQNSLRFRATPQE